MQQPGGWDGAGIVCHNHLFPLLIVLDNWPIRHTSVTLAANTCMEIDFAHLNVGYVAIAAIQHYITNYNRLGVHSD